jgi:23S rRNA (uracil1939-C5)-methyltransferase
MELVIDRMGAAGDGVGRSPEDGLQLFVPNALPGERVLVRAIGRRGDGLQGELLDVLAASPERVLPPCPNFGPCGGCTVQHWSDDPIAAWKQARLAEALSRAGAAGTVIGPVATSPPGSRRRADLAIRRTADGVALGLHDRLEPSRVFDLGEVCLVLAPPLVALFGPLRALMRRITGFRREGSAVLNLLESGPDLLLRTDAALSAGDRALLADFGKAHGLPRIAWALNAGTPEIAAQSATVRHSLAGHPVIPPPGGFLQATPEGEAAIVAAVMAGLPKKLTGRARILDLFAGIGTLSFPLAARGRITAIEGGAAAVAALQAASGQSRIAAERRDLARRPMMAAELKDFAAVVLDPPFAGAAEQMGQLARSTVPRIIYVSCNPSALGRDAKILLQSGYRIVAAVPIDQFRWSAHLESVITFARP